MVKDTKSPATTTSLGDQKKKKAADQFLRFVTDAIDYRTHCTSIGFFNYYRVHVESCKVKIFKIFFFILSMKRYCIRHIPLKKMVSELSLDGVASQIFSFTSKFLRVFKIYNVDIFILSMKSG